MGIRILAFVVIQLAILSGDANAQTANDEKNQDGIASLTATDTPLKQGEKIAFFGDSITMQGGYVKLMDKAIKENVNSKDLGVELIEHGLNGGRVPTVLDGKSPWGNLGGGMQSLLQKEKPTIVVIYLGINDVWHGEKGTNKIDFKAGLEKMIAMSKSVNATTVLCTPSIIGEEIENNAFNQSLGEYSDIIRKLADEKKIVLCDIHESFIQRLKEINPENEHKGKLTYDGVHMNDEGNALLADLISLAIIKACKAR